jgi:indole-3-acetate monooxygenase
METITAPAPSTKQKDLLKIAAALGPVISKTINEDENNRRISPSVVTALREAGFFKLYLPQSLGGLETDPLTVAKIIEEVAKHNTAAGWSLMVANSPLFMGGHFPKQGIDMLFADPDTFIAGSIHPPMYATPVEDGYRVTGRNPLLSNIHEAQYAFVTAFVMDGDKPKMQEGHPVLIGAALKAGECRIHDTWHTLGMKATDSNDLEAENVFVPGYLSFPLVPAFDPGAHFNGALYRFPMAGAAVACLLSPVSLAVASNAIEELKILAQKKTPLGSMVTLRERGVVQRKLGRAEALVRSARAYLHTTITQCWEKILAGETISLEEKAGLLLANTHVNQSCVEAVELVYTAAGTSGIYTKNKLAHYFTDAQVLRQHGFMNESRYETAGQVFFGLPPDMPVIGF